MRFYVGMLAYNAMPVLEAAIKSSIQLVDRIYVVEGSAFGASDDETVKCAKSFGGKVEVITGTWATPEGWWDEAAQRRAYLDQMTKGETDWYVVQDADEVWSSGSLAKVMSVCDEAPSEERMFTYYMVHFWRDLKHIRKHAKFGLPRWVGTYRLGVPDGWWETKINLIEDAYCYHYGHALGYERTKFKAMQHVSIGMFEERGYGRHEAERFWREVGQPEYDEGTSLEGTIPFTGSHPPEILELLNESGDWKNPCN